jgi:hypothetical protein
MSTKVDNTLEPKAPQATGASAKPPDSGDNLLKSLVRGSLGFACVSLAAFGVWAFAGGPLERRVGEAGLYLACAAVFVGLSGVLLHPLARGPRSLRRFYKIFVPAFGAYAVVWCAAWFAFRFGLGEWLASFLGSLVLSVMIGRGLGNLRPVVKVAPAMFILHSAGYFLGGRLMLAVASLAKHGGQSGLQISNAAKLCWGLAYGLGVGAGLGYAFFTFQTERPSNTPSGSE